MPGPPAKRRRKQRQNAGRQVLARKEDGNEPLMVAVKQENPEFDRSSSAEEAAEESGQPDQEVVSARFKAEKRCREELQKRLKAEEEELRWRQINPPERTPVVVPARIQVPSLLSEAERRARAELQARLKEEERLIQEERAKAQLQARLQAEAAQAQAKAMAEAQKAQAEAAKARAKAEAEAQARARAAEEARQKAKTEVEASAARAKAKAKLEQQRAAAKAKVVSRPEPEVKAKAKAPTPAAGASRAPPQAQVQDPLVAVKKETSRSPSPGHEAGKAGRPRKAEEKMPPEEKSRPAPTKQKTAPVAARGPRPEGVKASASKAKATPPPQQGSKTKPGVPVPQVGAPGASAPVESMVLVEIIFKGKKKAAKHKASTKISELQSLYEQRIRAADTKLGALRVCDENGVEQGSEVTLGLLRDSSGGEGAVKLVFEEDDWFS